MIYLARNITTTTTRNFGLRLYSTKEVKKILSCKQGQIDDYTSPQRGTKIVFIEPYMAAREQGSTKYFSFEDLMKFKIAFILKDYFRIQRRWLLLINNHHKHFFNKNIKENPFTEEYVPSKGSPNITTLTVSFDRAKKRVLLYTSKKLSIEKGEKFSTTAPLICSEGYWEDDELISRTDMSPDLSFIDEVENGVAKLTLCLDTMNDQVRRGLTKI